MSVTVLENIASELYDRLYAMIGDVSYDTQVVEVVRPTPSVDHTPKHLQIVMRQGASERAPEMDYPGNPPAVARRQTFNLHLHVHDTEETHPDETTADAFVADVTKAVTVADQWHTFGGYAIDAEFLDYEPIVADASTGGITLPLVVTYRTSELDPYTVR